MKDENVIENLKKYNQTRTLKILENVDETIKNKIIEQLKDINFPQLKELYNNIKEEAEVDVGELKPIKSLHPDKISKKERETYEEIGADVVRNKKFAVATMSGGQGTRLGYKKAKGTFKIDVEPEPKYLFQILAENLEEANKKYGIVIPWYIMTSTENDKETEEFFKKHNYFGYPQNSVKFFTQGNLPLLFTNGSLVLDKDYNIKIAADGNGCIYKSMKKAGILDEMKKNNIKWVFIGAVDNALLNMVDPILIGLAIDEKHEIASKSIPKNSPKERVGVFCKANGVPSVIEYSELPEEMAEMRDEDGELLYGEAHIMCNLYTLEALEKIAEIDLPYHVANKKTDYMNEDGEYIEVTEPNAYKFEAFIFDAFNYFDDMSILRGRREEDFAPVKNKEGNDSPETARKLYNDYHSKK